MKNLIAIVFLFVAVPSFSQYLEFGSGVSFTKFDGELQTKNAIGTLNIDEVHLTFNALLSGNIPLKYVKDEVVVGVNPNASLSLFYSTLALDVPVFATFKMGAGSSEHSNSVLGAGFGVGAQASIFSTALPETIQQSYSAFALYPSLMGEVSLLLNDFNLYQLRLEVSPVAIQKKNDFKGSISIINIRVIRAFL